MTTAGRFNKILFLKFLGKRVTASKKHQLPNTNFKSFSVKISVKISESDPDEYYVKLVLKHELLQLKELQLPERSLGILDLDTPSQGRDQCYGC